MGIFNMEYIAEYTKLKKTKEMKLFRLTTNNENNKIATPRIPDNYFVKNGYEDNKTPRVCFAPSIDKCLMALSRNCSLEEFFVQIPDPNSNFKIYKPSIKEVPDSDITDELWILEEVNQICIGKIKVIGDDGKPGHKFTYGPFNNPTKFSAELYSWNWEWVEKKI